MVRRKTLLRLLALLFAFGLVAAACGDSDDDASGDGTTADDSGDDTPTDDDGEEPSSDDDGSMAEDDGDDSAMAEDDGDDSAMAEDDGDDSAMAEDDGDDSAMAEDGAMGEATGEPIKIGFQNPEGDPAGSFPEYSAAAEAAAEYINTELGGLGGRPIELEVCAMAITPDDSQRCANELAADGVELVISSLNFFGNHFPILEGSNIPVIVGTPITVADFTSPGVYSIGAGGGCFGVHTGLVQFATQDLPELAGIEVNRVGVPWADTPPGVVCYYDLESKPLDVINGGIEGSGALAGSNPDLEHIGVPVAPGAADVTAQATAVLDFEPDVIIFSAQGSDCWTFVDALGRLGWTPEDIPLVLSGACTDFTAMEAAGDLALGVYLTSTENGVLNPLDGLTGQHLEDATTYQTKGLEYGLSEDDLFKGFAGQGFSALMSIWQQAQLLDGDVTGEALGDAYATADGSQPSFGGSPLDCAGAPEPYIAVCSSAITMNQWDGTQLVPVLDGATISGIDLVAGTEIQPGPYELN